MNMAIGVTLIAILDIRSPFQLELYKIEKHNAIRVMKRS